MERYSFSGSASASVRATDDETREMRAQQAPETRSSQAAERGQDGPAADESKASQMSVLGKTLVFKGELTANEDLLIQGRVEGSITHTASNLAIGPHGDVKADISARRVVVQGKVTGDIRATESVVIEVSANVQGNIFAPRVSLKDGAKFRGSIDMEVGDDTVRQPVRVSQGSQSSQGSKRSRTKSELSSDHVEEILG
jgi:cytoskeletal protein CcmA (bactofilin family)